MDRLETRELVYFCAVAEELHFGRAADRLGMAQPPLSRAIGRLERRMGVRLLERTSRRVALTPAGEVFLTESRRALEALDAAVGRTQRAARRLRLVVAVRPGTGTGLLRDLLAAQPQPGDAEEDGAAIVDLLFTHAQAAALREGTADVALLCAETDDLTGLRVVDVARELAVALVPSGHELAGRASVTLAELHAQSRFRSRCPALPLDQIIDLAAFGQLLAVVGAGAADRLGPGVTAVPVSDLPATRLVLAWPEALDHRAVAEFVRAAHAALGAGGADHGAV
ncbi:LysR family transcriptional regulator [Streptomyces sp. NPDC051976]|uniref:LysR family transcriptional regulator n=1 Tax=Streptomyces sp. NPDC051976 TaxID=3154947 RepID=UPI0034481FCB